jgi:hypothetical protein
MLFMLTVRSNCAPGIQPVIVPESAVILELFDDLSGK